MAKQPIVQDEVDENPPTPFEPGAEVTFVLKNPEMIDVEADPYQPGSVVGKVTPCAAIDHHWLADAIRLGKVRPQ